MTLEVFDERVHDLVDREARLEQVANGFQWTEGPVWDFETETLYFSDISGNTLYRYREDEGVEAYRDPSNYSNGLTFDHRGQLISCEHRTRRVTREEDGELEVLAGDYRGTPLNAPNDVIVARDGSIIFTDPHYGLQEGYGGPAEQELDFRGVFRLPPDDGELELMLDDLEAPNGLALAPEEDVLYVDDTERGHIRRFQVGTGWSLSGGEVLVALEGEEGEEGVPDGLKLDEKGNIYSTGPGGVWICTPEGEILGRIPTPEIAANLAWADEDARTMYITAATGLYRMRCRIPGHVPYRS